MKQYEESVKVTREALLGAVGLAPGPYQGWANAQTWCVALYLNNQKYTQDDCLDIVREQMRPDSTGRTFPRVAEWELLDYCRMHAARIRKMAPWVWLPRADHAPVTLTDSVSWAEIREHFEQKIKEGA